MQCSFGSFDFVAQGERRTSQDVLVAPEAGSTHVLNLPLGSTLDPQFISIDPLDSGFLQPSCKKAFTLCLRFAIDIARSAFMASASPSDILGFGLCRRAGCAYTNPSPQLCLQKLDI